MKYKKIGDILILEEGMIVAADAKVIDAVGLQVDESSLTGESIRVEKDTSKKRSGFLPMVFP